MSVVRFIVVAVLFIAMLFLALDNADTVTLRFFHVKEIQAPLIFVVLCALAAGAGLGLAAGALRAARLRRELNALRREVRRRDESTRGGTREHATPPMDAI